MKVFKTYYYELWHNMPIWLVVISILFLYPLISIIETPKIALINLVGITSVLFLTNIIMSASKKSYSFRKIKGTKVKYLSVLIRILLFIIIAVTFVTIIDLIFQAYFYQQFLKFHVYFSFFWPPCLVLSQYGSIPTNNTVKGTFINSINSGLGFGTFLIIIGSVSLFISTYWSNSFLSSIIGVTGLILIAGISKIRANKRLHKGPRGPRGL